MPLRSRRASGVALLVCASVLWSISGLAVKVADMDAASFAFYRALAAGLALLPLLPFSRGARPPVRLMLAAIPIYTCTISLVIVAMKRSTAASGILLQYTGPVFCALLAWIFQQRGISRRTWIALIIAMIGVTIMIAGAPGGESTFAATVGLASGITFGGAILVLEKLNRSVDGRINSLLVVCCNNLGAAVILLAIAASSGTLRVSGWQLGVVLVTGVVQLAAPYVLFQMGLERVEPVDASLLILLELVLNPVWVWLAIGEQPDASTFIGGVAILAAMVIEATKAPVQEPNRG
ncbi:MAG: DMT family transporter, partial [Tepidisphaeraceae bacterium]